MSFIDSHVGASLRDPWTQLPHRFFLVLRSPILMCTYVPLNFQATAVMGRTKGSGTKQNNKKANNTFCLPNCSASPAASHFVGVNPTSLLLLALTFLPPGGTSWKRKRKMCSLDCRTRATNLNSLSAFMGQVSERNWRTH